MFLLMQIVGCVLIGFGLLGWFGSAMSSAPIQADHDAKVSLAVIVLGGLIIAGAFCLRKNGLIP
jgi:membrane protein DedA with SNARE-associated domain